MPFPGNRTFKLRRPIKASVITGELNFDGVFCLTHADFIDFAPNAITLGHADAMQQGGVDLAVSSDEAGNNRLALEVRCELNATPANSRLELWVRVPFVSDTIDTDVWLWWGDETESLPAVDADYGRNDVWNGTTGGGAPIVTWGGWHFSEDPNGPTPQFVDFSGNSRHATLSTGPAASNIYLARVCGISIPTNEGNYRSITANAANTPGLGDFSIISIVEGTSATGHVYINDGTNGVSTRYTSLSVNAYVECGDGNAQFDTSRADANLLAMTRAGGNISQITNSSTADKTNGAAASFSSGSNFAIIKNFETDRKVGFTLVTDCGLNSHWVRAIYNNLIGTSIWDNTYTPVPAAVTATIDFDALNAGTEVRVYEQPHPQVWSFDLDGATPAVLALNYIQFQIQGESSASECYFWFRLDGAGTDPAPGGTGYRVDVVTGDTDAEMAEAAQAVLTAVTDLGATVSGTVVTVTNDRNGELTTPVDGGTDAPITLIQCGGTATDEIDGIESSAGTSWTASYSILRPRRATIAMLSIAYENVRYSTILTTAGLVVPAGALQREDRNYHNPS